MAQIVALAWLAAASASAMIGLLQYFGATGWAGQWLNHTGIGEAYGNLRQRNQFATLLNIGLAALLWWSVYAPKTSFLFSSTVAPRLTTTLLLISAALLGAGNATSSSRTGLIQLGLLSVLTWAWQHQTAVTPERIKHLRPVYQVLAAALLAYGVASLLLPLMAGLDPLSSGAWARLRAGDALCGSRLTLWGNVLHLIAQKPWLGWGWGELDYAHFITLYPSARFCDILDNAHNLPLHLAVELGIPVALLACGVAVWLVWRAKPWKESDATRQMAWAVLAVIGLHSLLEYPLWYGPFQMAALLSIWLLCLPTSQQAASPQVRRISAWTSYLQAGTATLLIGLCAFAAWNYQLASQIYLPVEARMAAYRDDPQDKIDHIWWFNDQVRFAELTTTDLTSENASAIHALALDMLHFSPEVRVIELVLDSAKLLEREEEVNFFTTRYQAAFPDAYAKWSAKKSAH